MPEKGEPVLSREPLVSVILPTLNSAASLQRAVNAVKSLRPEIIVTDGGSEDATRIIAEKAGGIIVASEPGRGRQLSAGAAAATGDWLLFLHSDTILNTEAVSAISGFILEPKHTRCAGYFSLAFDETSRPAMRTAKIANWRSRVFGLPYGDQGLLVHRDIYRKIGGYSSIPIMEDVDIIRRLGRRRLKLLRGQAITSAERYRRAGWSRRSLKNLGCLALYFLGVSPNRIAAIYG